MLKYPLHLMLTVTLVWGCTEPTHTNDGVTGIRFLSASADSPGFARANSIREFTFPRDHGTHPEFATEWWYFTGNLESTDRRRFGFELTFFRYALSAAEVTRASAWKANQAWLAHFTLTDVENQEFFMDERIGRGALNIAGAAADRLDVHVRDWSASMTNSDTAIILVADSDEAGISLELSDLAPIALHGEDGLDRKGAADGNASYYYSIPRMSVTGSIRLPDSAMVEVHGSAWMDREWATSSLEDGVEGWDWFSLQLSDDSNLMLYRLRNADGSINPFSTGTVMYPDGHTIRLAADAIQYSVLDQWTSPSSGVTYPLEWLVTIEEINLNLHIMPLMENQEFNLGLRYWEGAVSAAGTLDASEVSAVGYLELAGYL